MMFGKKRTPEEDVMSLKEQRAMLGGAILIFIGLEIFISSFLS